MEERTKGSRVATTDHTQLLLPGSTIGMAIGPEIAPSRPSPIRPVRVGQKWLEVSTGAAPSRRHDAWWRGAGVSGEGRGRAHRRRSAPLW